jgi:hypothetical protein
VKAGIKCAHCKGRHQTVAQVRLCAHRVAEEDAQARAEAEAEARNERWFEERGGPVDDPRERELWALEDERRFDAMIQQREREEDERVARFKADRDANLMGRTRRQRPW